MNSKYVLVYDPSLHKKPGFVIIGLLLGCKHIRVNLLMYMMTGTLLLIESVVAGGPDTRVNTARMQDFAHQIIV